MRDESDRLFDTAPRPPGEHLRLLLEERGWTQAELAAITGRSTNQINDIVVGKRGITAEMAIALGAAFRVEPNYWLNLDSAYRLSQAKKGDASLVSARAHLYDIAPVKDMQKRGWIKTTKDLHELGGELRQFFGVESLESSPAFPVSARKSHPLDELTLAQKAWCFRARELASVITLPRKAKSPTSTSFKSALRRLAAYPKEVQRLPELLADYGIRFVVVEPLPSTKIDGAAFWLDDGTPAVAVSARYDRIDAFWFTVMHEVVHVLNEDPLSVDTDLAGEDTAPSLVKDEVEQRADREAADLLVPQTKLDSFIHRVGPLYSKERIIQFAHTIKMHPGIIVGQLQYRGELGYSSHRDFLVKVRKLVVQVALTDGWGRTVGPGVL